MDRAALKGWVLYDGECPFCVRWLHLWAPHLRRRGFEIDTLQAGWTAQALGMTREDTLRDIRLLTADGSSYAGADVYLYVARKIWWLWPFGLLFSLPGFNSLIWAGYRWFAANRQCISGRCAVQGR
jgi:predicted DCC family thiol-disulfide oxidoreductase YuxK